MAGFVTSHLMDGVVDGVQVVLLSQLGQLELAQGGAVLSVYAHLQVLLGGVGDDFAQELGKLGGVLGLLQAGLLPIQADLGIALAVSYTGHSQVHTHLTALALKVGAQTVDDLLAHFLGDIVAEGLAYAYHMLGSPGLILLLLDKLIRTHMAHGALGGRGVTLVNITANRTYPFLHCKVPPYYDLGRSPFFLAVLVVYHKNPTLKSCICNFNENFL